MDDVMEGYAVKTLVSFVERRGYFTHGEARALAILKAGRVEAEDASGRLLIWIRQEIDPVQAAESYAASLATIRAAQQYRQRSPFMETGWVDEPYRSPFLYTEAGRVKYTDEWLKKFYRGAGQP
jgi:hypothetical protein